MSEQKKRISIVVPCFNEAGNVANMASKIREVMAELPQYEYENLFIDNDSTDGTQGLLRKCAAEDRRIKVILNNRNFGHDCSMFHGLISASGDAVIFICCDFQEPPELIVDFVKGWEQGAKVVWGQRKKTAGNRLMAATRSIYYKIIRKLSSLPQYDNVIGFGLYDREVIDNLKAMEDPAPFVRNMVPVLGYKPVLIPYDQHERASGKSSYNLFSYVNTALNALVHTSKVPLKLAIWIGMIFSFVSLVVGMFYLIYKLLFWDSFAVGLAPMIIMVSFIASLQLFFLGILGEYVLAIQDRVSFSKYVIEKERINFDKDGKPEGDDKKMP